MGGKKSRKTLFDADRLRYHGIHEKRGNKTVWNIYETRDAKNCLGQGTATGNCHVGEITIEWENSTPFDSASVKNLTNVSRLEKHDPVEEFKKNYYSVVRCPVLQTSWSYKYPSDRGFLTWYHDHREPGALKML